MLANLRNKVQMEYTAKAIRQTREEKIKTNTHHSNHNQPPTPLTGRPKQDQNCQLDPSKGNPSVDQKQRCMTMAPNYYILALLLFPLEVDNEAL